MSESSSLTDPFLHSIFVRFELSLFTAEELAAVFVVTIGLSLVVSLLQGPYHKVCLLLISLLFVILIDPVSAVVLGTYAIFSHFLLIKAINRTTLIRTAAWVLVAVLFVTKGLSTYGSSFGLGDFFVLAGLSYYTFRIASVLLDGARTRNYQESLLDHLLYCFFFPIFVAGPIQRRRQFVRCLDDGIARLEFAFVRISGAIILKLLFADVVCYQLAQRSQVQALELESAFLVLLSGVFGILRAFCDLQALTLLAIGFGRLCGYEVPRNFNHPFLAHSMTEFWQRWHMTLTSWSKDYVFMPILFATRNLNLAVLGSFLFMGIWHAPTLNWLLWGAGHAAGLIAHRYFKESPLVRRVNCHLPKVGHAIVQRIGWIATLLYVSIVFVSVSSPDFAQVWRLYEILLF